MPQEKKTTTRRAGSSEEERTAGPQDQRNKELDDETTAVLDDIDCCLAEVEADNRPDLREAKREWDAIWSRYNQDRNWTDAEYAASAWMLKYEGHVKIVDCCGGRRPEFLPGLD